MYDEPPAHGRGFFAFGSHNVQGSDRHADASARFVKLHRNTSRGALPRRRGSSGVGRYDPVARRHLHGEGMHRTNCHSTRSR